MKGFLKENTGFLAAIFLAGGVLAFLQFVSCGKSQELAQKIAAAEKLGKKRTALLQERAGFEGIEENLDLARKDNELLLEKRAKELKKWRDILGRENFFGTVEKKSSDDVNAEISRFLDRFRKQAVEQGVSIRGGAGSAAESDGFPGGTLEVKNREGFGFAGYDGAWPSISDVEARELLKQKIILEKLLTALFKARPKGEPMEILGIRRETVGEVDIREAANEALAIEPLAQVLAKRKGRIETYAFEVRFVARTHALRTFLNTLKHPFLIRDINVRRVGEADASFSDGSNSGFDSPFGPGGDESTKSRPIIVDVGSRFVVLVEFVLAVHVTPEAFLQTHYPKAAPPEPMLEAFLKASGYRQPAQDLVQKIYPKEKD